MRALFMAAVVVGVSGCSFGIKTCEVDDDCPGDAVCVNQFCTEPDGGTGGGSTGGGAGGGTTGGGGGTTTGGGAGGGTTGGGGVDPCDGVMCDPGYVCETGACVLKVTGVRIIAPTGGTYGPTVPLALTAEVLTTASVVLPNTLRVSASAFPSLTTLDLNGTTYSGVAAAPVGGSGTTTVTVYADFADAGFSAAVDVTVDRTPPMVSLVVVPPPLRTMTASFTDEDPSASGAFKRDERIELQVESSEPVTFTTADFGGLTPLSAVGTTPCTTTCGAAVCSCVSVNAAQLDMANFRQTYNLTLPPLADAYGNTAGAGATGNFQVTRWRWSRSVEVNSGGPPNAVHSAAVGPDGTIYVGVAQTNQSGAVWAVTPSGALLSGFDGGAQYGAITASPVVGDRLYVGTKNNAAGAIRGLIRNTGFDPGTEVCSDTTRFYNSAMALTDMDAGNERVVAVSQNGFLVAARPTASVGRCVDAMVPSVPAGNRYAVVAEDAAAFLATTSSSTLTRVAWAPIVPLTWGATTDTTTSHSLFTSSLARVGTTIGGGGGLTTGGVYAMTESSFATPSPAKYTADGGASTATGPAVGGTLTAPVFVYGNGSSLVSVPRVQPTMANDPGGFGAATIVDLGGGDLVGVPALGKDGFVYVVDSGGRVTELTSSLSTNWSVNLSTTVDSSLALDAARDATGGTVCGKPGSLYVASTGDGRLYSLIVDARGLNGSAPWPTYQHDNARTGNQTRVLDEWVCP